MSIPDTLPRAAGASDPQPRLGAVRWWDHAPGAPLVLAIDSSTRIGSLAIVRGFDVVGEASWTARGPGGSLHLDLAVRLMADHGLGLGELQAIVVATGPGSFTGIRAGLSTGQGIAEALGIPLFGVGTHPALVAQVGSHAAPGDVVCGVIGAGRGAVHAWAAVAEDALGHREYASCGDAVTVPLEVLADGLALLARDLLPARVIVGGEVDAGQARALAATVEGAVVLPPYATQRRAAWVVECARRRLEEALAGVGGRPFPEEVQPTYVVPAAAPRPPDLGWALPGE